MNAWIPSPLAQIVARAAIKTLHLLSNACRSDCGRRSCRYHSTVADAIPAEPQEKTTSGDALLARFFEIVRLFPRCRVTRSPPLKSGATPKSSDPRGYNSLMKVFSRAGNIDEVLRLFSEMKSSSDCRPNAHCYATVMDALMTANRPREAEAIFEEMLSSGISPSVVSCTILVKLYSCYLERFDAAYEVIRWMAPSGCHPDVVTYSTLVAGLCRAGRVDEAWNVLDSMLKRKCAPNVLTYTPILHAYCSDGRIGVAKRLVQSMQKVGCSPDAVAYNVLIQGLCKMGKFDEVENVLRRSEVEGWTPDDVSYNTYINGLCKMGKADEAFEQLEIMLGKGLHPTTVTLNILLDCLCREAKIWEVKCLLERSSELDLDVDVDSYNTVMIHLQEIGEWNAVLKLFNDMFKKGFIPNTQTFNIVIHSLCKSGKLCEAKCIFNSGGFEPDIVSYNILFHAFYVAGKICEIQSLFCNMEVKRIAPDVVTYNTMIDCLCKDGKFLEAIYFVKSLGDGISSELVARLTFGLVWGRKLGEMLRLFEDMLGRGLVLDAHIYNSLIMAFCRRGSCQSMEIYKICLILDRMLGIR